MDKDGRSGNFREKFGQRLRRWRSSYARPDGDELTQEGLARAVGRCLESPVSKSRVSKYENGHRVPDAEFLDALGRAYPGLNLDWLLTGRGGPNDFDAEFREATNNLAFDGSDFSDSWESIRRAVPAGSPAATAVLQHLVPRLYLREMAREKTEAAVEQARAGSSAGDAEPEPITDLEEPDLEEVGPVPVEFVEEFVEEYLRPEHAVGSYGEREAAMLSQLAVACLTEFGSANRQPE